MCWYVDDGCLDRVSLNSAIRLANCIPRVDPVSSANRGLSNLKQRHASKKRVQWAAPPDSAVCVLSATFPYAPLVLLLRSYCLLSPLFIATVAHAFLNSAIQISNLNTPNNEAASTPLDPKRPLFSSSKVKVLRSSEFESVCKSSETDKLWVAFMF